MSTPLTPADYFQPVLASARLHNVLNGELTGEQLRSKVIENLRVNFLRYFSSEAHTEVPEPVSLSSSDDNFEMVTSLITRLHERYCPLINEPRIFDYYLEEEDLRLADEFRTGNALLFLEKTLTPYLADLATRGVCSEKVLEEKYSEFLGMSQAKGSISAEDFWDSQAVMLYSSHIAYAREVEHLRQNGTDIPVLWYETEKNTAQNQDITYRQEEDVSTHQHRM